MLNDRADSPVSVWQFATDDESGAFCSEIVTGMIARFGVGEIDAIALINRLWRGNDFLGEDLRYHESPDFWAQHIHSFVPKLIRDCGP
jgi:hypothetical protein